MGLADIKPVSPELDREALRIWNEYAMTLAGLTYPALGYHTGDGATVPAWKVDEHMLAHQCYIEARKEGAERG